MRPRARWLLAVCLLSITAEAHVGSPDIFYEGAAGPYRVTVSIRPPDVVPGTAQISVRTEGAKASHVTLQPIPFEQGSVGAPRPDDAVRSSEDPQEFHGQLWLMEFGSYSVKVGIDGDAGSGSLLVPVPAIATARRKMGPKLGLLLGGLALLLVLSGVAIIGASVSQSTLAAGESRDESRRSLVLPVMIVTTVIFALALFFGRRWWESVDQSYLHYMFKPVRVVANVESIHGRNQLTLNVEDPGWSSHGLDDLIPDHGKLMHLFLIRDTLDAFAHLHPQRLSTFTSVLPPLPAGSYRMYADVVHAQGLTDTITATVEVPPAGLYEAMDPDDSWSVETPSSPSTGDAARLSDGSTMEWEHSHPLIAGKLESLRFTIKSADGSPVELEPYLGMGGHAVITRDDGSVFVHVHPSGTVSMAAQQAFMKRVGTASEPEAMHANHIMKMGPNVVFPYSFPKAGSYRLWVQVKRNGKILTGGFATSVN
jgi:hypothetical protein